MKNNNKNSKAFSSLVTCLLAGVLAVISFFIIRFGVISKNTFHEKQALDACGYAVGKNIIYSNDIQEFCLNSNNSSCNLRGNNLISEDTTFTCEDNGLVCDQDNNCHRELVVTSKYNPGVNFVEKSVKVKINEEIHDVERIDAAVIFLLDYSGSMQGNRINQLKLAINEFVNSSYNLSYSVIIYNNDIIVTSDISKGLNHDQTVMSMVNNNVAGGGTNFANPLNRAINQIESTDHEVYYIVLVSDGSPNEGISDSLNIVTRKIRSIDENNCIYSTAANPCITLFTLGVDNANTNILNQLSGNTLSQDHSDYSYSINANQTRLAFQYIVQEIMCRIGPVITDSAIHVFNYLDILEENVDYVYDSINKIIKFYDVEPLNTCTQIINNNDNITIRWGKPLVKVIN
jgi:uncharacterized protein YegL